MKQQELLELIANGENSGVEFKLDNLRPEQLAKEAVGMVNLQGGIILLGVSDAGEVCGISRPNLEAWVMDTVFGRYVHPLIIPNYQEIQFDENRRIGVLSMSAGTAKPYVVRHNDREEMYVRVGSVTRLATREQALRLFGSGGLLYTETLPVSGTSIHQLDRARLDNYFRDFLQDPEVPVSEQEWLERLEGMGFMTTDGLGQKVCTVAGLALFGIRPRRRLPQAGLRVMVFQAADKQYQALLDVVLDAPMVGRWSFHGSGKILIDDGLVEKFIHTIEPFLAEESNTIDRHLRRDKRWNYPLEAIRETVLNALVHRDWTRSTDIEITRYEDRLEVISPGSLPNSMTVEKMKFGRRTPRNSIMLEVMRDYGYVEARGMGVRTKVIPLTRQFTGTDPDFEATDDYLKTTIRALVIPMGAMSSDDRASYPDVSGKTQNTSLPERLLSLLRTQANLSYAELTEQTGSSRTTIQRHLQTLKAEGRIRRIGGSKGGSWEVIW